MVEIASKSSKFLDGLENIVSKSNYGPNKVIHVLEDVHLQDPNSREFAPETSDINANKIYYEINDDIDNISLTDLSNTLITENMDTICLYDPYNCTSSVYDIDNAPITN